MKTACWIIKFVDVGVVVNESEKSIASNERRSADDGKTDWDWE